MQVPEHVRAELRSIMDEPDTVGKEIARMMGCSRSTLYRILQGAAGPKAIRKLAKVLGPRPTDTN